MKFGAKYKKARRLGAGVFDKTLAQKFAIKSASRKESFKKAGSEFGLQLLEKQKAKTIYGLNERQFKALVSGIISKRPKNLNEALVENLENRLDNTIYRMGLASTRQAARQIVSHGHINVNDKRTTIPSHKVKIGDKISIRERSQAKPLFKEIENIAKERRMPAWLSFNISKLEGKVEGAPKIQNNELIFDASQIFQFYSK